MIVMACWCALHVGLNHSYSICLDLLLNTYRITNSFKAKSKPTICVIPDDYVCNIMLAGK